MPDGLSQRDRSAILLTTDAVGGVWRYTLDLAAGLRANGVRVSIAVLGPSPSEAQRLEAANVAMIDTGLPLDWVAENEAAVDHATSRLRALAAELEVASVHLHAPALAGRAGWSVPVVAVAHSCTATWWEAVRGGALPPDFAWRAAACGEGLRIAHAVIAPTCAHAEAVRAAYGPCAIEVVHNGAATHPSTTRPRQRAVLTAGRLWDEGKNATSLDAAAAALGAPVYAAGPIAGPNGARIALPHLNLLGNLAPRAMQAAYARSSVFASLARYEPFGLSVLEAALAGMRLVLSDIPSFRELWDGAATFVATGDDPAPALRDALAAPGDGGAQARARRYTLDATVGKTLAVHRRIAVPA